MPDKPCLLFADNHHQTNSGFLAQTARSKLEELELNDEVAIQHSTRNDLKKDKIRRELAQSLAKQPVAIWLDGLIAAKGNEQNYKPEIRARRNMVRLAQDIFAINPRAKILLATNSKSSTDAPYNHDIDWAQQAHINRTADTETNADYLDEEARLVGSDHGLYRALDNSNTKEAVAEFVGRFAAMAIHGEDKYL